LRWLSEYEDPSSRKTPDRSAQFIYNALNLPEWIVWVAAASGVDQGLVEDAVRAIDYNDLRQTQAAAVRDILPWELVAECLEHQKGRAAFDNVAPDLDAIYRSDAKKTAKQTLIEARLGSDFSPTIAAMSLLCNFCAALCGAWIERPLSSFRVVRCAAAGLISAGARVGRGVLKWPLSPAAEIMSAVHH
jgi:hypothetical protein